MLADAHAVRYAGFWKRMNAFGIDTILMQIPALLVMLGFYHFPTLEQIVQQPGSLEAWGHAFGQWYLVFSSAYNILLVAGPKQATWGKRFCGIKVVSKDGYGRVTLAQSAIRHTTSGISSMAGGLGFLTVAFTREKVGIHDLLAHTRVIYREVL